MNETPERIQAAIQRFLARHPDLDLKAQNEMAAIACKHPGPDPVLSMEDYLESLRVLWLASKVSGPSLPAAHHAKLVTACGCEKRFTQVGVRSNIVVAMTDPFLAYETSADGKPPANKLVTVRTRRFDYAGTEMNADGTRTVVYRERLDPPKDWNDDEASLTTALRFMDLR